jgi:parvulin-like peptidyl-prolyl isomerase
MKQELYISGADIMRNLKLSYQIPNVVNAIAEQKIIAQTANNAGIVVTAEEIQEAGNQFRLKNDLVKASNTFAWLKKHYLSTEDFEEIIEQQILTSKLGKHLFADQVEAFFYQNQYNYESAVIYEVILDEKDLALELFYAVQENETTFFEVAKKYIPDQELRLTGGYRGICYRRDFRPEIGAAIFAAHPPQIIKPISTPQGIYLIWVEEIISPKLDANCQIEIQQQLFQKWLSSQINNLLVTVEYEQNQGHSNFTISIIVITQNLF